MGDFSCFFYGTLIFTQILRRVITEGQSLKESDVAFGPVIPAVLKGYRRHKVFNAVYPAIIKGSENDETRGVLVSGLTSQDILRLDLFEGNQYVRTDVEVLIIEEAKRNSFHSDPDLVDTDADIIYTPPPRPRLVPAQTYVWNDAPALLEKDDWDPEDNAHYVGYVEDDESVEAIMKKFEELERLQVEFAAAKTRDSAHSPSQAQTENENLTEAQLEEVFKRTSIFTIKSATFLPSTEDADDLELWRIEVEDGNTAEFEEEDDYLAVDDAFWDEEFGTSSSRQRRSKADKSERRRGIGREIILQRYKVMQVKLQDRNGNYFTVKKKVSNVNPALPTYIRIPSLPVPLSWAHTILPPTDEIKDGHGSRYYEADILTMNLLRLGKNFQAALIDPPLILPGESPSPHKITLSQFASLNITKIIPVGFLFIWVEKEYLPDIIQIADKWHFRYVENFCWVKKHINNQIVKMPYKYFRKSKLTLLVFRKEGDIELRHQRNPDCCFDFVKPRTEDMLTEEKPRIIYDIIETLLPQAAYSTENSNGDRLIELWGKKGRRRQGWTSVVQRI
ncbi:9115_t:CDS:10 [Paraglomus occultum]|uniref:Putative gamma-glutamylcyclotransferase n=1 Tax=Paraglomus occultum TaxID=144539 RepID=A0A9N9ART7_9GLOM|nr:9115_t:CDS:10 [Paraglomus occultum]